MSSCSGSSCGPSFNRMVVLWVLFACFYWYCCDFGAEFTKKLGEMLQLWPQSSNWHPTWVMLFARCVRTPQICCNNWRTRPIGDRFDGSKLMYDMNMGSLIHNILRRSWFAWIHNIQTYFTTTSHLAKSIRFQMHKHPKSNNTVSTTWIVYHDPLVLM